MFFCTTLDHMEALHSIGSSRHACCTSALPPAGANPAGSLSEGGIALQDRALQEG
jgi:hypothetical protein